MIPYNLCYLEKYILAKEDFYKNKYFSANSCQKKL